MEIYSPVSSRDKVYFQKGHYQTHIHESGNWVFWEGQAVRLTLEVPWKGLVKQIPPKTVEHALPIVLTQRQQAVCPGASRGHVSSSAYGVHTPLTGAPGILCSNSPMVPSSRACPGLFSEAVLPRAAHAVGTHAPRPRSWPLTGSLPGCV